MSGTLEIHGYCGHTIQHSCGTGSLGSILGLSVAEEPEEQPTLVKEVNIIFQQTDGGGVEHGIRRFQGVELDSRRSAQEFGLSLRICIHLQNTYMYTSAV